MSEASTENSGASAALPSITPIDRLGLTLSLAIITHAVIVLGISFAHEEKPAPGYDAMEIILVQQTSKAPDDARVLAQASLEGGGDTAEKITPATPLPPPFPDQKAEIAMPASTDNPTAKPESENNPADFALMSEPGEIPLLTVSPESEKNPEQEIPAEHTPPQEPTPTASTLLTNSFKIAALSAEIRRKLEAKAERPKRKYISASTKEFKYAAYMEAWRAKTERIGNLNYPDDARRLGLSGNLILEVALKSDGSIHEIIIKNSSGNKILDDAAFRIVNLAAPFSPFPEDIRTETDILHITRTWQFIDNKVR